MQKLIFLFLFLFIQLTFSQSSTTSLENKIYNAIDVFVANPNLKNLKKLESSEKSFHPKLKPELLAFVILKCNKAYYENQFGLLNNAISSYEKAWLIFQKNKLSNYDIIESCLKPLGNLYTLIGDYENAENTIKQYYYIAYIDKDQQHKFAAILNLSNVYQNTGKVNEAIDLLEKTSTTEKLSATNKGLLLNNLANNYLLSIKGNTEKKNRFIDAKNAFLTSINLLKLDKNQSKTISNSYRNLALIYSQEQKFSLANSAMDKAITAFFEIPNATPREQAKLYFDKANLHFNQKEYELATVNLKSVFTLLIPNYSNQKNSLPNEKLLYAETVLLDAFDLQAALFLLQNQPKKALQSYQLSFHVEELLQSLLVYENSKIITQIRNRNRTEKCIEIYYSLFQKEKKTSYIESAFLLQEKTKAAVLQSYLSNLKTFSREEKLILEQLQNWKNTILREQQKLDLANISKINEAIKKQNELMLLLKSKELRKSNETTKELILVDLYSKLEKENAVLAEYFIGESTIYLFTIKNKQLQLESIANIAIPKIIQFIDFFSNSNVISENPSKFNHFANSTYNDLKLPKKSTYKNLIIIPDGILTFLPFEALITSESKTTSFSKMNYLLNDYTIGYNNSASFYLNTIPFQHNKETVLGVFPIFENSDLELTFSKKELTNLKANFKGTYLEKEKATFYNFKTNALNYSILHLSTHASSGDVFEPASIKFYDQEIMYSELYNLKINPDLVVLSACETGIGKLYKAEGAMSVARGFQFAGAQNLLFSLWKVNDYTTSVVMKEFYKSVKNGKSYFESNHQAKLDFLADNTIPNAKKSPYYWSAFVFYGTLEHKETTNYFLYLGLFLIVGFIVVLLFKKHKKTLRPLRNKLAPLR